MLHRLSLLFALLSAMLSLEAQVQKTFHVADPGIPGIEVITGTDAIEVRNHSGRAIIGLQTLVRNADGRGAHMVQDGLIGPYRIEPGASDSISVNMPELAHFEVEWVLFADGSFYGPQKYATRLATEMRVRVQFAKDLLAAQDREGFVSEIEKCGKDLDCMKRSPRGGEWNALNNSVRWYRDHAEHFPGKIDQIVRGFLAAHREQPTAIRHVSVIATASKPPPVSPKQASDGWLIEAVLGACKLTPDLNYLITASSSGSCSYTSPVQTAPNGNGNIAFPSPQEPPALVEGMSSAFWAGCVNTIHPDQKAILEDGFNGGLAPGIGDGAHANLYPWETFKSSMSIEYFVLPDGSIEDMLFDWGILFGYPMPYGPFADPDGGRTDCFSITAGDRYKQYGSTVQLTSLNTTLSSDYGAEGGLIGGLRAANFMAKYHCDEPKEPFVYPWLNDTWIPYTKLNYDYSKRLFPARSTVECFHTPPHMAGGGSGGSSCDYNDCCCCMAVWGTELACEVQCFFGTPAACGIGTAAAVTVESTGHTIPIKPTLPSDKIGIARDGTFLLDVLGSHQTATSSQYLTRTFTPPGGLHYDDIPVSGDWTGGGHASAGYYRKSTGEWFLDANADGVWNASDMHYTFGGDPSDVPVVGDWTGDGLSCIGVFRYGYFWVIDSNCDGAWTPYASSARRYPWPDVGFAFGGIPGDIPVVGNWTPGPSVNGAPSHHSASVGVVRCYSQNGQCLSPPYYWILDSASATDGNQGDHTYGLGPGCGIPNPQYNYTCMTPAPFAFGGIAGDAFIAGDWSGSGYSLPGVYRQGLWILAQPDILNYDVYAFGGLSIDKPLVGKW